MRPCDDMKYAVKHKTWYSYTESVPFCHNLVHLAPRNLDCQACSSYKLTVHPQPDAIRRRTDYFGNPVDYFSIQEAHERLEITSSFSVEVRRTMQQLDYEAVAWEDVVDTVRGDRTRSGLTIYQLSLPSPWTTISASVRQYAQRSFSPRVPILEATCDLNRRIHEEFTFDSRATTVHTPVSEVLTLRRGVCQDFTHLAISCFRSLGLSARYVSGYVRTHAPPGGKKLVGADASHAWVAVYGGPLGWIEMDPTNNVVVSDAHICLGWGRDYGDVSPIKGVFVGGGRHDMGVGVDVVPDPEIPLPEMKPVTKWK